MKKKRETWECRVYATFKWFGHNFDLKMVQKKKITKTRKITKNEKRNKKKEKLVAWLECRTLVAWMKYVCTTSSICKQISGAACPVSNTCLTC